MISVHRYESFEQVRDFQVEWDDFVEANGADIFMTYDWCRVWWKYYGKNRQLKIYVFRENDRIAGIMPLFVEKIWLGPVFIRAIKFLGSDFRLSQLLIPIEKVYIREVIEKLHELLASFKWDIFHIGPIAGLYEDDELLYNALKESFNQTHKIRYEKGMEQTYFKLTDQWERYLAGLSKHERGDIKRNYRYIRKLTGDEEARVVTHAVVPEEFDGAFEEFVEMHQKHWHTLGKGGHFGDWPNSISFHTEMAKAQYEKGRTRFFKTNINEHILGYDYCYCFGNKYYELTNARSGYNKFKSVSLGKIIFSNMIQYAISEGVETIDSMRGHYDHKLKMGGNLYDIKHYYLSSLSVVSRLQRILFCGLSRILNILYYKIWFCRIATKLPLKRRPLWKIWIKAFF